MILNKINFLRNHINHDHYFQDFYSSSLLSLKCHINLLLLQTMLLTCTIVLHPFGTETMTNEIYMIVLIET